MSELGGCAITSGQKGLWMIHELDKQEDPYRELTRFRIHGELHVPTLKKALYEVVKRHSALRAKFTTEGLIPKQVIGSEIKLPFLFHDLCSYQSEAKEAFINQKLDDSLRASMNLQAPPLFRIQLFQIEEREFLFDLVIHHIIYDGASMSLLLRELWWIYGQLVSNKKINLPEAVSCTEVVDQIEGDPTLYAEAKKYWLNKIQLPEVNATFPVDFMTKEISDKGKNIRIPMDSELFMQVREFSRDHNTSVYRVMLAAYGVLLSQFTNQEDIFVGMPMNLRSDEMKDVFGYFVNVMPVKMEMSRQQTFLELLAQVDQNVKDVIRYKQYPFNELVMELNPDRNASNLIYSTSFNMVHIPKIGSSGLEVDEISVAKDRCPNDMSWFLLREEDRVWFEVSYKEDLYSEDSVQNLIRRYHHILRVLIGNAAEEITKVDLLLAEDHELINQVNATDAWYPQVTIPERFCEQVKLYGDFIALSMGEKQLTYNQLDQLTNQVAQLLQMKKITQGQKVAILLERSIETVVFLLGILKAGAVYVPIDTEYPKDRIQYMLQNSEAVAVISRNEYRELLGEMSIHFIDVNEFTNASVEPVQISAQLGDLAYMIYTSGSTGKPKGVLVRHGGVLNLAEWERNVYNIQPSQCRLQFATYSFDTSVQDTFSALLNGARLHLLTDEERHSPELLLEVAERLEATKIHFPTAFFQQFVHYLTEEVLNRLQLKQIWVGGEALPVEVARNFRKRVGDRITLINSYGPTEATVTTTAFNICEDIAASDRSVPIGKPIHNIKKYVLNAYGQLCPVGVMGELYIGGKGLAVGYWNLPDKTAEAFVPHPFSFDPSAVLYRTGDLVRWLPDGNIEYMGRKDNQVKVRGFRIELGEIESALLQHPAIAEAAVVAPYRGHVRELVTYYTKKSGVEVSSEELRQYVMKSLPSYMVPGYFVALAELPLSPTGKLERKKLLSYPLELEQELESIQKPRTEVEKKLVEIWASVLARKADSIHNQSDFFSIGGHSLLAIQVVNQIRQCWSVKVEMKEFFLHSTVKGLARIIELKVKEERSNDEIKLIPLAPEKEWYELSHSQKRLWFLHKFDPSSRVYDLPMHLRLKGIVDPETVKLAIDSLSKHHESLCTLFIEVDGEPKQKILPQSHFVWEAKDMKGLASEEQIQKIKAHIADNDATPFDLSEGPLARFMLFQLSSDEAYLYLNLHHIITDGWSMDLFLQELEEQVFAIKENRTANLKPLSIRYVDYAEWQLHEMSEANGDKDEQYWLDQLQGTLPILDLPMDYPRPEVQTFDGAMVKQIIPATWISRLKEISRQENVSMYMLFLASYKKMLHDLSAQQDIIVGTPVAGRDRSELEAVQGFFVNTLAIRTPFAGIETLQQLLQQVKQLCLDAFDHQSYPFDRLVEKLSIDRDPSRTPIFTVMFSYQVNQYNSLSDWYKVLPLEDFDISKFDLTLFVSEQEEEIEVGFEYNTSLFKEETMTRFMGYFLEVLKAWDEMKSLPFCMLDLRTTFEQALEQHVNSTDVKVQMVTITERFQEQVERYPDAIALAMGEKSLTYRELDLYSNQVAQTLKKSCIGIQEKVAILLDRSMETVVSLLGVLKAGAVYVPVDPEYPQDRIQYMLEDSGASAVITNARYVSLLGDLSIQAINIERVREVSTEPLALDITPDNFAYVIYTSGSTGRPKGTLLRQRGVINLAEWYRQEHGIRAGEIVLQFASFSFDASVGETFGALLNGAQLHFLSDEERRAPDAFVELVTRINPSLILLPTALFHQLMHVLSSEQLAGLKSLKRLLVGGEALPVDAVRAWQKQMGDRPLLYNVYGPTEATVAATSYLIDQLVEKHEMNIPIGKPLYNTKIYLLDEQGQACPVGAIGEICIENIGLAAGYLNQPEKMAEAFVPHPRFPDQTIYRTGDLARFRTDGNIEYMGRKDDQVKVRGYRIELGEIESVLLQHRSISEAVVVAPYRGSVRELVAYYTMVSGADVEVEELRQEMLASLPSYMIPGYFIALEELPLSPTGKVDRKKLLSYEIQEDVVEIKEPRTAIEKELVAIWESVLNRDSGSISIDSNFFSLGGHSLLAIQVVNQVKRVWDVKLEIKEIFLSPTVCDMAQLIEQKLETQTDRRENKITRVEENETYALSHAQKRLWFLYQYHPSSRVYDVPMLLQTQEKIDHEYLKQAIELLCLRHDSLRTVFVEVDGEPRQQILEQSQFTWDVKDLTHVNEAGQQEQVKEYIRWSEQEPFNLSTGPLMRVILFQLSNQYQLYFNFHHIITDGWSIERFLHELKEQYEALLENRPAKLYSLPIRYVDYAEHQALAKEYGWEKEEQYWLEQLGGSLPVLELPTDYPRPEIQTFDGAIIHREISPGLANQLAEMCQEENVSMYMLLLTGYQKLLHYLAGQSDIIVGTPTAGRDEEELENVQGFFVNTIAIRTQFAGITNLQQLLQYVRQQCLDAFEHQAYPFDQLIEKLDLERDSSRTPIFSTMFAYQAKKVGGEWYTDVPLKDHQNSKFDLSLSVIEEETGFKIVFEYNTNIFKADTIERFTDSFLQVLRCFVDQRHTPFEQLYLLPESEEKWLQQVNQTQAVVPDITLSEMFTEQVKQHGDSIALSMGDVEITYQELDRRTNQIAQLLQSRGVQSQQKVVILLERSIDTVLSLLGILKAGAIYVPVDPAYPEERVKYMIEDSQAQAIITRERYRSLIEKPTIEIIDIMEVNRQSTEPVDCKISADDLAYMIYTSGSTGKPKGTLLQHRGVISLILQHQAVLGLSSADTCLQFSSYSFDASVEDTLPALLTGARLHMLTEEERTSPEAFIDVSERVKASKCTIPTASFQQFVYFLSEENVCRLSHMRHILVGGEALPVEVARSFQEKVRDRFTLWNAYGPTEATVDATWYKVQGKIADHVRVIPIGKPVHNTKIHILNQYGQPCPFGTMGEIYIESIGLAVGYWNQPEKTAAAFVPHPFSDDPEARLYRSGDLGRWLPCGNVEYMGRKDDQVKVRGYRIELGEIEATLHQYPSIVEAVVLAPYKGQVRELIAYYTTSSGEAVVADELRKYVANTLPNYMIPSHFYHLDQLPITAGSKVDRKKLLSYQPAESKREIVYPSTEIEKRIAQVWSEVLEVGQVGIHDDFFKLGGHSLRIMPALLQLKPYYPILVIQDFFLYRTVEAMAAYIEREQSEKAIVDVEASIKVSKDQQEERVIERPKLDSIVLREKQDPQAVFLTGATGFLGAHILHDLIQATEATVYCLVRADDEAKVLDRLKSTMEFYFGNQATSVVGSRVHAVSGDLSFDDLGITDEIKHRLTHVDTVIHCGADVRHYGEEQQFQAVNVSSTESLIKLCTQWQARFHYVSTLSIVGHKASDPAKWSFTEHDFDRGQNIENVYVKSKFEAERLVKEAGNKGLPVTIHRVGNLVAHSETGQFQRNIHQNAFYRFIKAALILGAIPPITSDIDLTPINYCSQALVYLTRFKETIGETFHLCNPALASGEYYIKDLQSFGYNIQTVEPERFFERIFRSSLTSEQQEAVELMMPQLEGRKGGGGQVYIDCERTQAFLADSGIQCAKPNKLFVHLLLDYGVKVGFFPSTNKEALFIEREVVMKR
ncbi:amino acid adenylation domain-containing protein [Bacillus thuringiensis]|uniref:non-ribosomal peptide synthetase n=1 Tax=Bacillus thuringiensis TaxID=1428 RepID=UPI00345A2619